MLIPRQQIGASYGDALMAGVGAGVFESLSHIKDWIDYDQETVPDAGRYQDYQPLYKIYRDLYDQTKDLMGELSSWLSMN